MALCPFAKHLLIRPGANDPRIRPRAAILHVDAGNASSLYDYFLHRSGGIESHFLVTKRLDPDRPGRTVIEQYRDTDYEADANYHANPFAVSIETQGFGEGEWSTEQLRSIFDLLSWLSGAHPIPLREIDRWDGSGVGYHTQFGAPGPWTPVSKSCPGPQRKVQYRQVIVPWLGNPTQKDWFDMVDKAELREIVTDVVGDVVKAVLNDKMRDIGAAVMTAPLQNRNADGSESTTNLRRIITNIEVDQDRQTKAIRDLAAAVNRGNSAGA